MVATAPVLRLRAGLFDRVRRFFVDRGFLEVDTPLLLHACPAEAANEPFAVSLRRGSRLERRYLPTSPELGLKRLLAILGADLFEIGHAFRNGEEEGRQHRAHFRLLEWYRPGLDWERILQDAGELLAELGAYFEEQGHARTRRPVPSLSVERLTVAEAFARDLDFPMRGPDDLRGLPALAASRGHGDCGSWEEAFHLLMGLEIQPRLGRERPTALTHYPAGIAVQARPCSEAPWLAEQFEIYIRGVELMNCYTELSDLPLLRRRCEEERTRAAAQGLALPTDESVLADLAKLPEPTGGGCLGLDRLLMLWLDAPDLDAVRP